MAKQEQIPTSDPVIGMQKRYNKKWLLPESPTQNMWLEISLEKFKREKITTIVNDKKDHFMLSWKHRMDYI